MGRFWRVCDSVAQEEGLYRREFIMMECQYAGEKEKTFKLAEISGRRKIKHHER